MVQSAAAKVASLAAIASSALVVTAHPLCFYGPDRAVSMTADAVFCPDEDPEGFCCEPAEEDALIALYDAAAPSDLCAPLYQEVRKRETELR